MWKNVPLACGEGVWNRVAGMPSWFDARFWGCTAEQNAFDESGSSGEDKEARSVGGCSGTDRIQSAPGASSTSPHVQDPRTWAEAECRSGTREMHITRKMTRGAQLLP